jgi:hypothetical protein
MTAKFPVRNLAIFETAVAERNPDEITLEIGALVRQAEIKWR